MKMILCHMRHIGDEIKNIIYMISPNALCFEQGIREPVILF